LVSNRNIHTVLKRIDRLAHTWRLPSVSEISALQSTPYTVLIATLLSLRTKDAVTEAACQRLFVIANQPAEILKLDEKEIQNLIYPVAFYRNKARSILDISHRLLNEYGGVVPDSLDELLKFKGVGRKTANLVLILGYNKPAMCVDTHVHRISNRLGYIKTSSPDESEMALRKKLPVKYWLRYNDLLVAFGQNLCRPVSPHCTICPVRTYCARRGVGSFR